MLLFKLKKDMVIWGLGRTADSAILSFLSFFLLYYYNQILGLEPILASIALALAMLFDALSDPIIGLYSDYQNMAGRRRSRLMKLSILPCVVTFLFLFLFEFGNSQLVLFFQLAVLTVLLRFCLTLYIIPREALGVQIFDGYNERNELWAINAFFNIFGASLALGPTLLFFVTDWENKSGYFSAVIWTAFIYFLFSTWCVAKLKPYETVSQVRASPKTKFSYKSLFLELNTLFKNRSWLMLFVGCLFFSIQSGLNTGTSLYFNNFLWHWEPDDIFWGGFISLPGSILGALTMIFLNVKEKRHLALKIGMMAVFTTPLLLCFRLLEIHLSLNFLPNIGEGAFSSLWWLWSAHQFSENFLWTIFWILIASMFSDTIEEQEMITGSRLDGLVLSANNLINKALLSSGTFFSGVLLTLVGFGSALSSVEKELAASRLGFFYTITILVFLPIGLFFISKYCITRDTHEYNLKKLKKMG